MRLQILARTHSRAVVAMATLVVAVACKGWHSGEAGGEIAQTWTPSGASLALNIPTAAVSAAIQAKLAGAPPAPLSKDTWGHAQRLYNNYKNAPLWLTGDGLEKTRAGALMLALADGSTDGLRLEDYPLGQLGAAIDTLSNTKTPTAEQLANIDVMLTAAYVALGEGLMTGQIDPKSVNQSWHISGKEEKVDSALFRSIRADQLDKAIALMRPRDEGYDSLRVQLAKYRLLAQKGLTTVPEGKILNAGQTDSPARITALKTRLSEEGYFTDSVPATTPALTADSTSAKKPTPASAVFSRGLASAVGKFQSHHGIVVDSSLGIETVNAMNVSAKYRAAQIAANLERYRWMPRALGERYVMVNVPAFKVVAYDSGKQVLEMKVIVGMEYEGKATPVFADTMQYVVFRPYWNVPPAIQAKEFDSKIAADPGYLDRGGFEYYKESGKTRIRQKPGTKNALGLVKFLFPNDFNIYLHDTPNDELFKKDIRAFSHGCIRLAKPDSMAQFVLGWDMDKIHEAMNNGPDNTTITLKQPIPVFITYFTTYVTDGELFFGNDLYKRDGSLVDMMVPGALPPEDAERATRALHAIAENWGVRDLNH
jgi:murein L,D-transpeptidase YcbB/YkuD